MNDDNLLDSGAVYSEILGYIYAIKNTAIRFYGIYILIWFVSRWYIVSTSLPLSSRDGIMNILVALVLYLIVFFFVVAIAMIWKVAPFKKKLIENLLLVSVLSFGLSIILFILLCLVAGLVMGIIYVILGFSGLICLDIAAVLMGLLTFYLLYYYMHKKLLKLEKELEIAS